MKGYKYTLLVLFLAVFAVSSVITSASAMEMHIKMVDAGPDQFSEPDCVYCVSGTDSNKLMTCMPSCTSTVSLTFNQYDFVMAPQAVHHQKPITDAFMSFISSPDPHPPRHPVLISW